MKIQLRTLVITALFIALTYVFTLINVNLLPWSPGGGGLTHLGNIPIFIAAILFGKTTGAIVGGIGTALFDITSEYLIWAPATLIVNVLMAFAIGLIVENRKKIGSYLVASGVAIAIKVVGYYIAELIIIALTSSAEATAASGAFWLIPIASIPANIIQVVVAAVVVLPIIDKLRVVADKFQNK